MFFNNTLLEAVCFDLDFGHVPALIGEPGIGKSAFVANLAKTSGTQAFVLACNQLADKADLTGARLVPTPDGKSFQQMFYPHVVIQEAISYAQANPRENPILFFDEINRSTSDVTSAVLTMVTLRKLGQETLPDNLRIVVAGNDKGNVTSLDTASISRFSVYRVEPEADTLMNILGDRLNPWVKQVLLKHPEMVFQKSRPSIPTNVGDETENTTELNYADLLDDGDNFSQLTTPRTIENVSTFLNTAPLSKIKEWLNLDANNEPNSISALHEILVAHVGETEFVQHLISEITESFNNNTQLLIPETSTAPIKPSCYDTLKAQSSITELDEHIAELTEKEKTESLIYALYEKEDNAVLIKQLSNTVTSLGKDGNRVLVQLASASVLDNENVEVFTDTNSAVAKSCELLLSAFA